MALADYIQLINTENIGPITFYKLVEQFGTVENAIKSLPQKFKLFPRKDAEREIKLAESKNIRIITYDSPEYPERLKQLEDAPPVLYVLGNINLLNHHLSLSIVGARNASINGRKTASKIAYDLSNNDILIISGMARGIDSSAHLGAMYAKEQQGATLAVLGTGIDIIYPKENTDLYEKIIRQGVIVSEFPIGTDPQSTNFPRRNRIVSALSDGTLVVEATVNSGSLITARLALEQGKDIFAIPGSPNDARALGPNKLIKEGAILVESADDILETLVTNNKKQIKPLPKNTKVNKPKKQTVDNQPSFVAMNTSANEGDKSDILDYLSHSGIDIDELIRISGLDSQTLSLKLFELEFAGIIERQAGNKVALIGRR